MIGKILIWTGLIILILGIALTYLGNIKLPLLPGDIFIKKENFTFYFPIVTSILLSIAITIIINLFR